MSEVTDQIERMIETLEQTLINLDPTDEGVAYIEDSLQWWKEELELQMNEACCGI
jgi:hypothetical protein